MAAGSYESLLGGEAIDPEHIIQRFAQIIVENVIPGREHIAHQSTVGVHGVVQEGDGGDPSVTGHLLVEVIVVALVGKGLLAQGVQGHIVDAAVVDVTFVVEEGGQIHVGGQLGLTQIQVIFAVAQGTAVGGGIQLGHDHGQTALGQHIGDGTACLHPEDIVLVHQQRHLPAGHLGGDHRLGKD